MIMATKKPNVVRDKSFAFALQVVTIAQRLHDEKRAYVLANQFLRSSTAIGALVREAEFAQSKPDFTNKMHIALKEANETDIGSISSCNLGSSLRVNMTRFIQRSKNLSDY